MKTINNSKTAALVAVAFLGATTVAFGAHADEVGVNTRAVQYADLNLNTADGANVLYQRIRHAAKQVCGDEDSRQLAVAAKVKACVDQAMVSSVLAVDKQQLTRTAAAHGYAVQAPISVASLR